MLNAYLIAKSYMINSTSAINSSLYFI